MARRVVAASLLVVLLVTAGCGTEPRVPPELSVSGDDVVTEDGVVFSGEVTLDDGVGPTPDRITGVRIEFRDAANRTMRTIWLGSIPGGGYTKYIIAELEHRPTYVLVFIDHIQNKPADVPAPISGIARAENDSWAGYSAYNPYAAKQSRPDQRAGQYVGTTSTTHPRVVNGSFQVRGAVRATSPNGTTRNFTAVKYILYDEQRQPISVVPVGNFSTDGTPYPRQQPINITSASAPRYVVLTSPHFQTQSGQLTVESMLRFRYPTKRSRLEYSRYWFYYPTDPTDRFPSFNTTIRQANDTVAPAT